VLDGGPRDVSPSDLRDPSSRRALADECRRSQTPPEFDLCHLLDLGDEDRFAALAFLARAAPASYRAGGGSHQHLLDAVLAREVAPGETEGKVALKRAAVEAAVLACPDALDVAASAIAGRLKAAGVSGATPAGIRKEAEALRKELLQPREEVPTTPTRVLEALADAPAGPEAVVPPPWALTADGLALPGHGGDGHGGSCPTVVVPAPLIIIERAVDVATDEFLVTLAWKRRGAWKRRTVERVDIADARRIVALASHDLPVSSLNAKELVRYLGDYENANIAHLPEKRVSRCLGWLGPGREHGFLLGELVVTRDGLVATADPGAPVMFRGADHGDEQLASGFTRRGSPGGWADAVRPLAGYPRVLLALFAGLVPPLLPILRAPGFIVDLSGESTGGKTTALRVAASAWGNPDESDPHSVLFSWDGTSVWRERAPAVMRNLPLLLDDTQRARRQEDVEQTIYDISQGRGRGRGSPKGLAGHGTWQTVLLSSGEQPAVSFSQAGGTRARVLSVWGSPLGGKSEAAGGLARELTRRLRDNFGHAGPGLVQHLLQHPGRLDAWRDRYRDLAKGYAARAGANALAGRLAEPMAAIHVAAEVCDDAGVMPWPCPDPIGPLWQELTSDSGESDRAEEALRHVINWAAANPERLFDPGAPDRDKPCPHGGWAGVRRAAGAWGAGEAGGAGDGEGYLGLFPDRLFEVLRQAGFSGEAVVRTWHDRGYLRCTREGNVERTRLKVKVAGNTCWVVAVRRSVIDRLASA
jgi:hypothetical protein